MIGIASDSLIPINEHFKISAGPGAGKTHWLVNHIKNVLQHSDKLGSYKKIACITYTNVAVDTIVKRLDFVADRVEVSTIHGFLYKHIIKPYMSFIADEHDFNVKKMDGHDDHNISRGRIVDWIKAHPNVSNLSHPYTVNQLILRNENLIAMGNWLQSLGYKFEGNDIVISIDNSKAFHNETGRRVMLSKANCLDKLAPGLLEYKKMFWRKGILHHDDVLYFAFLLLKKFPFILTVLRAKFPYFFIDEFQDTSPIQTEIVKMISTTDTVIGVIGDRAQSIFSFQGANPDLFTSFSTPSMVIYLIKDNRRSSNQVVGLLNKIRTDMQQDPVRNVEGARVKILIGSLENAFKHVSEACTGEDFVSLSRDNTTSNILRRQSNSSLLEINLLDTWNIKDSNGDRRSVVLRSMKALELGRQKRFKESIQEMSKNFYSIKDRTEQKKVALAKISLLLSQYNNFRVQPLFTFYELVKSVVDSSLSGMRAGAIKDFYDGYTYDQVGDFINIPEDDSWSRTIHKAKGDEFDNVLMVIKDESNLSFLLNPNLSSEEQRVYYVAASRSRERLFINVPTLTVANETALSSLADILHLAT